ncbi:MAG: 30S ribosomal protein S14 [Rhodospirillales bacterium]
MAKKSMIEKNKRRMRLVERDAAKRQRLKAMAKDAALTPEERFAARLKLAKLPRSASPVRVRLRCSLTGRPRGNYRKFGISRIALRELASSGQVPGVVKASW